MIFFEKSYTIRTVSTRRVHSYHFQIIWMSDQKVIHGQSQKMEVVILPCFGLKILVLWKRFQTHFQNKVEKVEKKLKIFRNFFKKIYFFLENFHFLWYVKKEKKSVSIFFLFFRQKKNKKKIKKNL